MKPILVPLAAAACQLCDDVPGTQVAIRKPTVGVAIEMGGGPAAVYGGEALASFDQFATG